MVGTGLGIFLSDQEKEETGEKISFLVGLAMFCYFTYRPLKKLLENQSIIVFDVDSIQVNQNKLITIRKADIESIFVSELGENGSFLNIKTKDKVHQINISWLDKAPHEFEELISVYRNDKTLD